MKKILISGSNGFVGQNLCKKLHEFEDFEIYETGDSKSSNLCDASVVNNLPSCDVVVHLAAKSFVPDSFINPSLFYKNNIDTTINLLEKARMDGSKFIFLSTYVYGTPKYQPIDEEHPINALNPYTQSKLVCEDICKAYSRDFGVPVIIFRPFNVYGKNQNSNFFIPTIISQLNKEFITLKDPRPKRDFIYVDDLVSAIFSGIVMDFFGVEIYNIGSGVSVSVKETVEMIVQASNSKAKIEFTNEIRKGEVLDTIADISKARRILGWSPKINMMDGLKKLILKGNFNRCLKFGHTNGE
jgi:nucleoside-diphosphate-sugar epimerase